MTDFGRGRRHSFEDAPIYGIRLSTDENRVKIGTWNLYALRMYRYVVEGRRGMVGG